MKAALVIFALGLTLPLLHAADPFAEHIRPSGPLTPQQQQKAFHLPPGFEIQLFAAEPDIGKPLNMAFDAKGRLWVTESSHYPHAAKPGETPRDRIRILEDTDADGRADRFTTFADNLNIPIGLYPMRDGAIGHSIPSVWRFDDRDGDDRADDRRVLYDGFGFADTHGMVNALRRGFDGWLYACHGFHNHSTIKLPGGGEISMHSGNTFRMRLDGSDLQVFTHGQTNPFGLAFDGLGNLYSADCHSAPIYQLLRGGFYISLGKTHDGLGFAPEMLTHTHNSTGIAGVVYYEANHFPPAFRGNLFIGNVVTSRINRDSLAYRGATPVATEEPDFLTCDDPWFRPVDLLLGPDGAIYVADFYNRIVAHYEVPLDHPGRDRERGRIWRIIYTGDDAPARPQPARRDWSSAAAAELIEDLDHPNLTVRMTAMHELADRIGPPCGDAVSRVLDDDSRPIAQRQALWVLYRIGELRDEQLQRALRSGDMGVRIHAVRVLAEMPQWSRVQRRMVLAALEDPEPLVQRCAIDALGAHPQAENWRVLLDFRRTIPPHDTHLLYVCRVALRDHLAAPGLVEALPELSTDDVAALVDVAPAVDTPQVAALLLRHLDLLEHDRDAIARAVRGAVQHVSPAELGPALAQIRAGFGDDIDLQLELFEQIRQGLAQRGVSLDAELAAWGTQLARRVLESPAADENWQQLPLPGSHVIEAPWTLQRRRSVDGDESLFVTSFPPVEQRTGILRSRAFDVPARLRFFIAGHNGHPGTDPPPRNRVRLIDAQSGEALAEALPPRNDVAHPVEWDLSAHAGRRAWLEIIDADDGSGYAWLAVGRLDPPVVPMPAISFSEVQRRQVAAIRIAGALRAGELSDAVLALLLDARAMTEARIAALHALAEMDARAFLEAVRQGLGGPNVPPPLRQALAQATPASDTPQARAQLLGAGPTAPDRLAIIIAQSLAASPEGAAELMAAIEARRFPPRVLLDSAVRERLLAAAPARAQQIERLTRGIAPPREEAQQLIEVARSSFDPRRANPANGAKIFAQNCAACHRIGNEGGLVGPQLDGIGTRGLDRLLEDVLDPNRNLDPAFRYSTFILDKGQALTGLPRKEDGDTLTLTDTLGREITIRRSAITRRIDSTNSLMPDNFGELLEGSDLDDLMAYLLAQRPPAPSRQKPSDEPSQ